MDVNRWNQYEPSGRLYPEEFENPEQMADRQLTGLGITRNETGRVMRMTRTRSGKVYHPHGDAVPATDPDPAHPTHAPGSLHRSGLMATREGALANDFDFQTSNPDLLFELYLALMRIRFTWPPFRWTAIGVYPDWMAYGKKNPGFHVDQRSPAHPSLANRRSTLTWIQTRGIYVYPSGLDLWKAWKKAFGLSVSVAVV